MAQECEQHDRDAAIAAVQARYAASMTPRAPAVERDCIDCGLEIEAERLRVLRVTSRCARCAHIHALQYHDRG